MPSIAKPNMRILKIHLGPVHFGHLAGKTVCVRFQIRAARRRHIHSLLMTLFLYLVEHTFERQFSFASFGSAWAKLAIGLVECKLKRFSGQSRTTDPFLIGSPSL